MRSGRAEARHGEPLIGGRRGQHVAAVSLEGGDEMERKSASSSIARIRTGRESRSGAGATARGEGSGRSRRGARSGRRCLRRYARRRGCRCGGRSRDRLHDREAQADTAEPPRRSGIDLVELREDRFPDPTPRFRCRSVGDGDEHFAPRGVRLRRSPDGPRGRELHRVDDEILDDLHQALPVADDRGQRIGDRGLDHDFLLFGPRLQRGQGLPQQQVEAEGRGVDRDPAELHPGEIEEHVDVLVQAVDVPETDPERAACSALTGPGCRRLMNST